MIGHRCPVRRRPAGRGPTGAQSRMTCFPVMAPLTPSGEDPLRSLLRVSHQLPAHRFGAVIQEHGRMLGALETVV